MVVSFPRLRPIGPYLAEIRKGGKLIPFLIKVAWDKSWGIFLGTPLSFVEVRKHLRRFLEVSLEGGDKVLFRFYDPRVLRVFVPTCTPEQRRDFFGSIEHILAESGAGPVAVHFDVNVDEQLFLDERRDAG